MFELTYQNKLILGIGAHPDDLDFACGATVAKLAKAGARIIYLLATTGQRGSNDQTILPEKLAGIRKNEQYQAARTLGVSQVIFLNYNDGELTANLELKEKIVIYLRKLQPEVVISLDPSRFYYKNLGFVNHADHRAIGEAALDACYPLARDLLSFPQHKQLGLTPHKVKEIFLPAILLEDANFFVDVSDTFTLKLQALKLHYSQTKDFAQIQQRLTTRAAEFGKIIGATFAEAFVKLTLPG